MTDVIQAPAEMIPMMENSPMWAGLQALAHTLPYDLALTGDQGVPVDYLAKITVPVLVLGGANSPDWFHRTVEATTGAIPGARLVMLDGQDHGAPPEVIAPVLTDFFLGSGSLESAAPRALGSMRASGVHRVFGSGPPRLALGRFMIISGQAGHGWGAEAKAWRRLSRLPAAGWCPSRATR